MRTILEIQNEVDYLINAGLTPAINTEQKRNDEVARIQSNEAKSYLNLTDWYVTRFLETNVAIPSGITSARADARTKVI